MKPFFNLVVVIPIGPNCKVEFICDTIQSVEYYVHSTYKILLSDDSQKNTGERIKELYPQVEVLKIDHNYGKGSGLYFTLAYAYDYALEHFAFNALLRLDTDALIIEHDPEVAAVSLFEKQPDVGMAGQVIRGSFAPDEFGNKWDNRYAREMFISIAKMFTANFAKHAYKNWTLRKIMFKAILNGYDFGDFVFGGTYIFSYSGLLALKEKGLLPLTKLSGINYLEEDHLFSLLIMYAGLKLGDLGSDGLPFGCAWRGLPASPEQLTSKKKRIIHSTRFWNDMKEDEVRSYFRSRREGAKHYHAVTSNEE